MFGNRRHFRELLAHSEEKIASNILADRLKRLTAAGLLSRRDDPSHRQKAIYSLSAKAIELVPLLVQMGAWGRHLPVSRELAERAGLLERGGPKLSAEFMDELRHVHLGKPYRPKGRSVSERLRAAYAKAVSANSASTDTAAVSRRRRADENATFGWLKAAQPCLIFANRRHALKHCPIARRAE